MSAYITDIFITQARTLLPTFQDETCLVTVENMERWVHRMTEGACVFDHVMNSEYTRAVYRICREETEIPQFIACLLKTADYCMVYAKSRPEEGYDRDVDYNKAHIRGIVKHDFCFNLVRDIMSRPTANSVA
jgi:hypothetical protein